MLDLAVFGTPLLLVGWAAICNARTRHQRMRLIDALPKGEEFWPLIHEFRAVDYDTHLWRLITFRDPIKLYGPLTQAKWITQQNRK